MKAKRTMVMERAVERAAANLMYRVREAHRRMGARAQDEYDKRMRLN